MATDFSPHALADLEEIALYIARDDPKAAEAWIDRPIDRAEKVSVAPRGGHRKLRKSDVQPRRGIRPKRGGME